MGTREALFAGLYDAGVRTLASLAVRLLNPGYGGDDTTCRRFAFLEID